MQLISFARRLHTKLLQDIYSRWDKSWMQLPFAPSWLRNHCTTLDSQRIHHLHRMERWQRIFFCVAVECAKKMPCVSDRTRLFQYLHSFLKQWDRDCFRVESHKVGHKSTNVMKSWIDSSSSSTGTLKHDSSSNRRRSCPESLLSSNEDEKEIICSRLAFNHGDFPHDLFGGEGSEECLRLRQMFGYDLYL
mmetsp:Transcript_5087/g.7587  ORF Transcript_5087/g.7587 Transcript_5087/m.7587 type:complete len:191 (+) Transcript_5087:1481-2053(+)